MLLRSVLSSGDQAEVLTSKTQLPQPEWEEFLVTAKARTRLRQALRRVRQPLVARGKEILDHWLIDHDIPDNNSVITKLLGTLHVPNRDELCYQLGAKEAILGDFLIGPLRKAAAAGEEGERRKKTGFLSKIKAIGLKIVPGTGSDAPAAAPAKEASEAPRPKINPKEIYPLRMTAEGSNFKLSDCCNVVPGDDVMGFINDAGEVEIHALDCPRAQVLKAGFGSRIVATTWESVSERFLAHIRIEGIDRHGILQELISLISTYLGIDIRKLDIEASAEVFHCDLWVRVADASVISALCDKAHEIEGVNSAARISH